MTEQERDRLARETAQRIRELAFSRTGYDHHKAEHIIAEALARGAAPAGAQGPWLPIETAPKDGTWIVAVGRLRHEPRNWRACLTRWSSGFAPPVYAEGWSFSAPGYSDLFDPVYWLPQPQPPSPTPSPADQEGR